MTSSLPRRRLLATGAAFAASAVLTAPSLAGAATTGPAKKPAETIVVRWNSSRRMWAARPKDADFGVVFLSTNDPDASAPNHKNVQAGDVWRRHPDAVEV